MADNRARPATPEELPELYGWWERNRDATEGNGYEFAMMCGTLFANIAQLREALTMLLTVEPQDRGHIHTLNHTNTARQVLGIPDNMPMGAWIAEQRRLSRPTLEED